MSRAKILTFTRKALTLAILLGFTFYKSAAQQNPSLAVLEFKYGFQWPMGDMRDRFGANNQFGVSFSKAFLPSNILAGIDGMYFFSNNVKEDVVADLRTFDGTIIGADGFPGDVVLKERGYYLGLYIGKIFKTTDEENNLTGIRFQVGGGLLQHKVRVQDNSKTVRALQKDFLKGYDRLTNGPCLHLGLGFQYQNPLNNFHFSIMSDVYAARTESRRSFDNQTGGYLAGQRTDILAGLTVSYIVSLSRSTAADHIYY